jgi:hypothetical protein
MNRNIILLWMVILILSSELGTALPQADSQQKAIILMLKKRVDVLLQKFEEAENDHQGHIADG